MGLRVDAADSDFESEAARRYLCIHVLLTAASGGWSVSVAVVPDSVRSPTTGSEGSHRSRDGVARSDCCKVMTREVHVDARLSASAPHCCLRRAQRHLRLKLETCACAPKASRSTHADSVARPLVIESRRRRPSAADGDRSIELRARAPAIFLSRRPTRGRHLHAAGPPLSRQCWHALHGAALAVPECEVQLLATIREQLHNTGTNSCRPGPAAAAAHLKGTHRPAQAATAGGPFSRAPPDATLAAGETAGPELERQLMALFSLCVRLGGTLSGEHGIGLAKREAFHHFADPYQIGALQAIKRALDPSGIFNPGKVV